MHPCGRKRTYMKLMFHWNSKLPWVVEFMGWRAGLMFCLMGGNHLMVISKVIIFVLSSIASSYWRELRLQQTFYCYCFIVLQHCTKMADNSSWFTYNPLVSTALCSPTATLRHARSRNYRPTSHDRTPCTELYSVSNIVRWAFML